MREHAPQPTLEGFGVYALGLIPALLILGPVSDRRGRRRITLTAGLGSGLATVLLIAGDSAVGMLFAGRLLSGVCSGAAFVVGSAWVKELSTGSPSDPGGSSTSGGRRAALALSAGFAIGPLVAGLLAELAPSPLVTAYLPHLLITALVLVWARATPDGQRPAPRPGRARLDLGILSLPRFRVVVAPAAPWVFVTPSIAFATLPALLREHLGDFQIGFAAVSAALTLGVGVLTQPLVRRLDADHPGRGAVIGLASACSGLLTGAAAVHWGLWVLAVPADVLLGISYGLVLASSLGGVHQLADPGQFASATAIFYALTYIGFAAPLVVGLFTLLVDGSTVLLGAAAAAALTLAVVQLGRRRQPTARQRPAVPAPA